MVLSQKSAVVFPGQGSQSVGMLKDLIESNPDARAIFDTASTTLGYDLFKLTQEGPEDKLNQTEYAQPALLTAGYAVWSVWQEKIKPAFLAGHSLGEYTALVCAEALDFKEAVLLVADRGHFMQEAVPKGEGAMLAVIGLNDEQIKGICDNAAEGDVLSIANYNSIGQIVLAGTAKAIERAAKLAEKESAKLVKILPVSVPSHCMLMQSASIKLAKRLQDVVISVPKIPVIHNADVCAYEDSKHIKDALVRQLFSPVRWVETILWLQKEGVDGIFECGPGKVLTGLNKRILSTASVGSLAYI